MPEIASAKLSIDPRLLPGAGARVLDAGCGDGRHLVAAVARGSRVTGVDFDAAALRATRRLLADVPVDLVCADLTRLPFRDAAFDAAICTETLEHLPDDRGAIDEIARVLRDGAPLLGAVPSHFTELVFWRLSPGYRNAPGGHVRIYGASRLVRRLNDRGLLVTSVRYLHFVDSLIWLRFSLADAIRRRPARSAYEAAAIIAAAAERRPPAWRIRLRKSLERSRCITLIDAAGAFVWPKSLAFVARRRARPTRPQPVIMDASTELVRKAPHA